MKHIAKNWRHAHLSIGVKAETGHSVRVDVPQNGHGLHRVGVPNADVRLLPHLTRRHLDLIWMHGQAGRDTYTNFGQFTGRCDSTWTETGPVT